MNSDHSPINDKKCPLACITQKIFSGYTPQKKSLQILQYKTNILAPLVKFR